MTEGHICRLPNFLWKLTRKHGKALTRIDEEVVERFKLYRWPGDVRDLENMIERAVVLCQGDALAFDDFPMDLRVLGTISFRKDRDYKKDRHGREHGR